MNEQTHHFELADLRQQPEVVEKLTHMEEQLTPLLGGKVALIAYVNKKQR
jgi:hypothetical protein